ncbi:MFS transporter [Mycobacterium sp. 050134]|uniref:MFS transporter n=1 Tax=Mycobacterium sp. 050134 TaxID=3096111 RepID=UPI002ED8986F
MLIGALIVDAVGYGLFMPLSLVYFVKMTGVPIGMIGILVSFANVISLPAPLLAGWLADRLGARRVVIAAQVIQGMGYLLYSAVAGPYGILFAVGLVSSGVRCFWACVFTAIADLVDGSNSPSANKDSWYAWANMARTAGISIGGLITSVVVAIGTDAAYRTIARGSAACFLAAAVAVATAVRSPRGGVTPLEDDTSTQGYRTMLRDRLFISFVSINTVFALSSRMLALSMPVFVAEALHGPSWLAPVLLVANTVALAVLAAPVVRRLAPYRRTRVIATAAGLWAAWCIAVAILDSAEQEWTILALFAATVLFTTAELIHAPLSMALATALSPPTARGRYLASFQYSFVISGIIAPTFFTTLFQFNHRLPWLVLGILNIVAIPGMLCIERMISKPQLAKDPAARSA